MSIRFCPSICEWTWIIPFELPLHSHLRWVGYWPQKASPWRFPSLHQQINSSILTSHPSTHTHTHHRILTYDTNEASYQYMNEHLAFTKFIYLPGTIPCLTGQFLVVNSRNLAKNTAQDNVKRNVILRNKSYCTCNQIMWSFSDSKEHWIKMLQDTTPKF